MNDETRKALNALFTSGAALRAREAEVKRLDAAALKARKAARSGGHFVDRTAESDSYAALARSIENELRWTSRALVTVFTTQTCATCNSQVESLTAIMVEQEHKTDASARRLLRSVVNHPLLPRRRESWHESVEVCAHCYSDASGTLPVITPLPLLEREDRAEDIQNDN